MGSGGKRPGSGRKKITVKTKQIRFSIEPEYEKELKDLVKSWRQLKQMQN